MQCGAKCKATQEQCRRAAITGKRVCYVHGGMTPNGLACPQTKHGRYSKHLPTRLNARYKQALADPELISVREELALVDVRTFDVLGRVDTREAGAHWVAIRKAIQAFSDASSPVKRAEAAADIESLSAEALSDYAAWSEVLDLVERRRKLAETEAKRLEKMGNQITADRLMLLLAAVVDVIRRHVPERKVLSAISRDITELVNRDDPR